MGEDKNRNHIGKLLHNFHVFLQQNNPLKIVFLRTVRVLITNWLARMKELLYQRCDGTNAGTKLWRHYLRERMGLWDVRGGTFLYVGIHWVSTIKLFNPVHAQIKTIQKTRWPKYVSRTPSLFHPWNVRGMLHLHFLVLLCIAVSCNQLVIT